MKSDLEIARECRIRPIGEIAAPLGLSDDDLIPYGRYMAKIPLQRLQGLRETRPKGKLILVTAMTPTPRGEGKTTNTIGLGQSLAKIGKKTVIAIREPSLGPCMGLKGGAAGGGYSQVLPMEEINLHFTGDMHAVSMSHNLLSALIDNHLHQALSPELHARRVVWKRVIDMNDRSLRSILLGLDGQGINGVMREDGFEITAASEVMAVLCLAADTTDLKRRLGQMVVGYDRRRSPVTCSRIGGNGAMAALLKNAVNPNLVQTNEGVPVLVHGGPFANIAHGCNTIFATEAALRLGDYVVTEAGFGADLGAEKFFDIKCRTGNLDPSAAVLVVTVRAFRMHGIGNIERHVRNVEKFGVPVVVSVNRFADDTSSELSEIVDACAESGIAAIVTDFRETGGDGGIELAEKVVDLCETQTDFTPIYPLSHSLEDKIRTVAREIYGADDIEQTTSARKDLGHLTDLGYGELPVCIAKTPASFTDNPKIPGSPTGFDITVTGARVSAGAGFVVVYTGNIMTMPGLPKTPAALSIDIDAEGNISGLF